RRIIRGARSRRPARAANHNNLSRQTKMDAMGVSGAVWLALVVFGFILAIAWIILPFALIGTKPLLRRILDEQIRMNALLASLAAARRPQAPPRVPSRR